MSEAIERKIQEKIIQIDKIKSGGKAAYAYLIGFPVGIAMLVMYLAFPSIQSYLGTMLLFGIGFILLGIGAVYDIKYGFPKRLAKAEAEYEESVRQK